MLKFRNDKERTSFLEDYTNEQNGWRLWKSDDDLQRRWWRYELPDCSLIVEEQLQEYSWPSVHTHWEIIHWYIIKENQTLPFAKGTASRTQALAELKRCEKGVHANVSGNRNKS